MKKELEGYPSDFANPSRVDPDLAEKLKAIGYLSQTAPISDSEALPNPRDRIEVHEGLKAASRLALQGKSEDALVAFRRLLEEAPGSFEVQRDLAEALARLRRYPEAAAAYKAEGQARLAMADAETESEGAMTLADVLGRLGRFAEAQAVLEEQIRAFPRRAQTYASLAVMLALQGRPRTEVYGVLESMAKANPGRETIFLGAKTLDFVGDKDAATVWRRRAASPGKPVP